MKTEPAQTKIETKPTKTPNGILSECIEFSELFKDIPDAKFDALARIYISRMMNK